MERRRGKIFREREIEQNKSKIRGGDGEKERKNLQRGGEIE
jgi:hypothetical protein